MVITDGHAPPRRCCKRAVSAFRGEDCRAEALRWLWLADDAAPRLWDHESWLELAARAARGWRARRAR